MADPMTVQDDPSRMINAVRELDSGVAAHIRWLGMLNKAIICGTPVPASISREEGFRHCPFGSWLYAQRADDWAPWATELAQIEILHRAVHGRAREVFARYREGGKITPDDYDSFLEASLRFRFALRSLSFHMIDEVCLVNQLTGVWNRSSMYKRLSEEQDRMLRSNQSCCLCMMDLDHFKDINDRHGHMAGDKVLQSVIEVASSRLRTYDAMFRYGGEEFLFCLPNAAADVAVAAMERVRGAIERTVVELGDGQSVSVTASFGVAPLSPTDSIEESIKEADRALFGAKAGGRNRVCRWDVG